MGHRDYIIWLVWSWGGTILAILCAAWALWRGGRAEREYVVISAIGWVITPLLAGHNGPGPWVLLVDTLTLLAYLILGMRYRKIWLTFAAACQINDVVTHIVNGIIGFDGYSYVTMVEIWAGWAQIFCLFFGMISYRRSLRRLKV